MKLVKFLRISRGLTRVQLNDLTGIYRQTITHIENGRTNPTEVELRALSRALGCPANRLLDDIDETRLGLPDGAEHRDEQREAKR